MDGVKFRVPDSLPEGIEEALPQQARALEHCRRRLLDCFERWGYALVLPPLVEFHDVLVDGEEALEQQTFRLTDPLSGRALGVRADMTPQAARIDRQQMPQDRPARLCYAGPVLRMHPEILGGGRNPIQVGAELYGHDGVESDAEIVLLLCAALRLAGCARWCLDLGHAGVFRTLARCAQWEASERDAVFDLIQRKAYADLDAWLATHLQDASVAAMLRVLPDLSGTGEAVLDRAAKELSDIQDEIAPALESLREVAARVRASYPEVDLHFDLAEASGFHYESGLVFAAYMEGQGQEIARGGRYGARDARPATGFSLDLRTLVRCGSSVVEEPRRVFAAHSQDPAQQAAVDALRDEGSIVVRGVDAKDSARANGCPEQLICADGAWAVRPVES